MGAARAAQRARNQEPSRWPREAAVRGRRRCEIVIALSLLLLVFAQQLTAASAPATLAFAISIDGPPLAFKRAGVVKGLQVDLARALAAALEVELNLHALPEPRLLDALRGGRIDVMLSALPSAELTALGLATSEPVLDSGQMAIIRSEDLARFPRLIDLKLTDQRVGYQRASLGARLVQARLPRAERVPFADANEGLAALRAGDIAVFIHEATTAWALASDPEETELTAIFRPLSTEQWRFVTRSEDAELLQDINRVLKAWRESQALERIILRWIPIQIRIGNGFSWRQPEPRWSAQAAPTPACHRDTT